MKLLCRLGIHLVPTEEYVGKWHRTWLWGSSEFVKTKNPYPYCIREVDAFDVTEKEITHVKERGEDD